MAMQTNMKAGLITRFWQLAGIRTTLCILALGVTPAILGELPLTASPLMKPVQPLLTREETIGAVFFDRGLPPSRTLSRHANPTAKADLWKIINDSKRRMDHAPAIAMLGAIGDAKDAKALYELLRSRYSGRLGSHEEHAVHEIILAIGYMAGHGVREANEQLEAMVVRDNWRDYRFQFRINDPDPAARTVDRVLYDSMTAYVMAGNDDLEKKAKAILMGLEGKRLASLEYNLRLADLRALRDEWNVNYNKSVVTDELRNRCRKGYEQFQLELAREAARVAAGDKPFLDKTRGQESLYYRGDIGDTKIAPGPRPRTPKGVIQYDKHAQEMAGEAKKYFDKLLEDAAGDKLESQRMTDQILIEGFHEKWDESKVWKDCKDFDEVMQRLRKIFVAVRDKKPKAEDYEVWLGACHPRVDGRSGRKSVSIIFKLEGTEQIGKELKEKYDVHMDNLTIMPDGTLAVWIKNIDGDWYWNPFGW